MKTLDAAPLVAAYCKGTDIGTTLAVVFGAADKTVVPVTELLPKSFNVAPVKFIFLFITNPLSKLGS